MTDKKQKPTGFSGHVPWNKGTTKADIVRMVLEMQDRFLKFITGEGDGGRIVPFDEWEMMTPAEAARAVARNLDLDAERERKLRIIIASEREHKRERIAELEEKVKHAERIGGFNFIANQHERKNP